ncbi:MAG: hypothetical protein QM526_02505 [Alphaproteobacteria bacterium]|nr:hypothetical protein [Alphaproteobacteria bacterium]
MEIVSGNIAGSVGLRFDQKWCFLDPSEKERREIFFALYSDPKKRKIDMAEFVIYGAGEYERAQIYVNGYSAQEGATVVYTLRGDEDIRVVLVGGSVTTTALSVMQKEEETADLLIITSDQIPVKDILLCCSEKNIRAIVSFSEKTSLALKKELDQITNIKESSFTLKKKDILNNSSPNPSLYIMSS